MAPGGPPERRGPDLRVGDAEREAVVADLRVHAGHGRLTLDEFEERAAAWTPTVSPTPRNGKIGQKNPNPAATQMPTRNRDRRSQSRTCNANALSHVVRSWGWARGAARATGRRAAFTAGRSPVTTAEPLPRPARTAATLVVSSAATVLTVCE